MNWDALGAGAEMLGALAVIVSIIYLAAQVKQTRIQLQAQAEDNITARAFEAYEPVYQGDNASIFRRGLESPESLNEDELFVFKMLMDRQRGAFATIIRRRASGAISTELADRLIKGYQGLFVQTNGGRLWLQGVREKMSEAELQALELIDA